MTADVPGRASLGLRPGPLGVVLCGGASSRMGTDKALLGPPDRPLAGRVAAALRDAGCVDVVLVGGDRDALRAVDATWVPDSAPGEGPLGAVATVAQMLPGTALAVCACDLPWIEGRDLAPLLAALGEGAAVAVFDVDGAPQWSAVVLSAPAATAALHAFLSGERSLHGALAPRAPGIGTDLRVLRPDRPGALRDADRPTDLPPDWPSRPSG